MPDPAEPTFDATLHYSKPLMRRVVFAFWRRTVGIAFPLVLVVLATLIMVCAGLYGMNWFLTLLAAVVILGTLLIFVIFVTHYRHLMARFGKLESPNATLVVSSEQFTVTSDLGSSTMTWRTISEIWCFPEFWLVMFSKSQFMTLPLSGISTEVQQFIREQVEKAGGSVQ